MELKSLKNHPKTRSGKGFVFGSIFCSSTRPAGAQETNLKSTRVKINYMQIKNTRRYTTLLRRYILSDHTIAQVQAEKREQRRECPKGAKREPKERCKVECR